MMLFSVPLLIICKTLKKGLDRASKSGKFVKENKSMTPVLGINTASSCKKSLLTSEPSESLSENLLSANVHILS